MPDGRSQTAVTAWPSENDLSFPTWLIHAGRMICGGLCAAFVALVFKLAVKIESTWWAATATLAIAALFSTLAALVLPAPPLRTRLRGLVSALLHQPSTLFALTPGLWLAVVVITTICATAEIGIGLFFVLFASGYFLSSVIVDRSGLGWNSPKNVSALAVPASIFMVAGLVAFNMEQILSLEECVTTPVRTIVFSAAALGAGGCLAIQNASLAELAYFMGRQARASAFGLWTAAGILGAMSCCMDPDHCPEELPDTESIQLLLAIGVVATPVLSLTTHLAPHGAVLLATGSELMFVAACIPLIVFEHTSLPPRRIGFTELVGVGLLILGFILVAWGSHRKKFSAKVSDHCQVCARNDQELFIGPEDFQAYSLEEDAIKDELDIICSAPKPIKNDTDMV